MTRGMKGCYVYFVDKETEKYFKSKIKNILDYEKTVISTKKVVSPYTRDMVRIPLLGNAPCGNPFWSEENIEEYIDIEKSKIKNGYSYFILRAVGDSMNLAGINDGDLVLVRQQETAENGDTVVALVDNESTIKELHYSENVILLKPRSKNKSHKPIIVSEDFKIQGKVITTMSNFL